jgi:hypothetical protein
MSELHLGARQNAKTWGQKFSARLIEPGLVSYEDCGGTKELLTPSTLLTFASTFEGKPVIVRHQSVTPANFKDKAVGYISKVWHNSADGWWECEGVIIDDEAKELIRDGWMVSCAYHVKSSAPGGTHHGIAYGSETTAFEGEHLAIVERPRYENATIRLNSKTQNTTMNVFKWFKKKDDAEAARELDPAAEYQVNGETVRLNDLADLYRKAKTARENSLDPETLVEIDGEKVALKDLIALRANGAKKEEEKVENALVEDKGGRTGLVKVKGKKKKENESDEEEDESEEEEKKEKKEKKENSFFDVLAAAKGAASINEHTGDVQIAGTLSDRIGLGKAKYGSDPVK